MKQSFSILWMIVGALWSGVVPTGAQVNVTQHHNHDSRDGLYVDPTFTQSNAAGLTRDLGFDGTISGNVYAQPLYVDDGPGGVATVIAATESNKVYALDATDGTIIWQQQNLGASVALTNLPCGNINPVGITGTPVIDLASRSIFLDAMTTPDGGTTKKHLIYSLNLDTGAINPGWPVDVNAVVPGFTSSVQGERAALSIVGNILYVPYGGHAGDCGTYHGWLVGVQIDDPTIVMAWATDAIGGGAWATGGVASDGTNPFMATGNTFNTGGNWGGGEAIIRFQPGPIFTGDPSDYWAPSNWLQLDNGDVDLGGSGPLLVDVPGAIPSQSCRCARQRWKCISPESRQPRWHHCAGRFLACREQAAIIQAAASYRTNQATYVAFRANSSTVSTFQITATNPPTITNGWICGPRQRQRLRLAFCHFDGWYQ